MIWIKSACQRDRRLRSDCKRRFGCLSNNSCRWASSSKRLLCWWDLWSEFIPLAGQLISWWYSWYWCCFLCGGRSGLCYFYSHSSVEHGRLKYVPEKETGPKYPDLLRKMAENHQAHLEVSLLEEWCSDVLMVCFGRLGITNIHLVSFW